MSTAFSARRPAGLAEAAEAPLDLFWVSMLIDP
jgi:hypothetical protein